MTMPFWVSRETMMVAATLSSDFVSLNAVTSTCSPPKVNVIQRVVARAFGTLRVLHTFRRICL